MNFGDAGDLFRDAHREDPQSAAVAVQLFGKAGIDVLHRDGVVYTTNGNSMAYFAARLPEYCGGKQGQVDHGGIDDGKAAGKPVSTQATQLPPVALTLSAERVGTLWTHEVAERARSSGTQIVDARTPKEYSGEDIRAIRGGHIAGAINIPCEAH